MSKNTNMIQLTRILFAVVYCVTLLAEISAQDSISQISPKSLAHKAEPHENIKSSFALELEDEIYTATSREDEESVKGGEQTYTRVERSALPIVNDAVFSDNKLEAEKQFGRYVAIDPTATTPDENSANQKTRHNEGDNFLAERGRQARQKDLTQLSRPRFNNSAMPTENVSDVSPSVPRQQNNPDIQDIITGIVNLLNGNVNVHANGQGNRRPPNNRINNRGPPRISEAQVANSNNEDQQLLIQQQQQHTMNVQVPVERPENTLPLRPFLTGVPLPEQIVPSMQQNLRPGFISQNRPPWKRRPTNTFHRRPILHQQPQQIPTHYEMDKTNDEVLIKNRKNITSASASDQHEIGVNNIEVEEEAEEEEKEEGEGEKEMVAEKEKERVENESIISPTTVVTIIQSTSEVNTIQKLTDSSEIIDTISSSTIEASFASEESTYTSASSSSTMTQAPVLKSSSLDTLAVIPTSTMAQFHPRPGVVLDDPEFKPGQKTNHHQHSQQNLYRPPPSQQHQQQPDGYGEIFDVTLSAIQGPTGNTGSKQTINIKPFNYDGSDILLAPSGDQGFVSIDGKRTYINLLGESTDAPLQFTNSQIQPTQAYHPHMGITGSGQVVAETEPTTAKKHPFSPPPSQQQHSRPNTRPKFPAAPLHQPSIPVRIDTCIVGDDSTCDQTQNEKCKTENGVSSCNCKPGYARRKHREPCRKIVSLVVSLRVDRYRDHKVNWDPLFNDSLSEPYRTLKYESFRAIDTAMSMTPFSDEYMDVTLNNIYQGDASKGMGGVFLNLTLMIEESMQTIQPTIRNEIQRHLIGVIHRRNNNIGNSLLYVESPPGSVSAVQDLNECLSRELNDCHVEAICINHWGSYTCQCNSGFKDPNGDRPQSAGRECLTCSDAAYCNNRGTCSYDKNGNHMCNCIGSFYGSSCEIDGEVLAVAVGASIAAIVIIILTLVCLIMWSRKWQREHKNAMIGSPVFGYMGAQVKTPVIGPPMTYQVSLEDRMRWAQIADVMAQSNHYAAEPVAAAITRPSSAMFPTYHSQLVNGGMTLQHHPHHHHTMHPPVPLPRLGLRSNGARTLENSSSSEEEDRIDLLGRNFQVPRPKSRSNTSLASAIYYDVDYLPSGGEHIYGTATTTTSQIPLSTYGAPSSTTYYK